MLDDFAIMEFVLSDIGLYEKWDLEAKWRQATQEDSGQHADQPAEDGLPPGSSSDGAVSVGAGGPANVAELRQVGAITDAAQEQDERTPVRHSMQHLEKAGRGKKGLAVCQQIVMARAVRSVLIFLLAITSPVRREFGFAITKRKTKWGLEEWLHKMCTGKLADEVLEELYGVNFDDEVAKRMGLSPSLGRDHYNCVRL